jgi:hypothetical protein
MTSAQLKPSGSDRRSASRAAYVAVTVLAAAVGGCARLTPPDVLASPYPDLQLWAVAPFANESGVSTVDGYRVADLFTQEVQEVQGINTVPVNRVVAAMRHANLRAVESPEDAMLLIRMLDVDALVVGTVTAWEPYPPPTMGMAVQLFAGGADARRPVDPRELVRAPSGDAALGELGPPHAVAQAAGVFDARNHQTLTWLKAYASGRTEPEEPFGTEVYLMDMELYTQFVSHRLIHDLLGLGQAREKPGAGAKSR